MKLIKIFKRDNFLKYKLIWSKDFDISMNGWNIINNEKINNIFLLNWSLGPKKAHKKKIDKYNSVKNKIINKKMFPVSLFLLNTFLLIRSCKYMGIPDTLRLLNNIASVSRLKNNP